MEIEDFITNELQPPKFYFEEWETLSNEMSEEPSYEKYKEIIQNCLDILFKAGDELSLSYYEISNSVSEIMDQKLGENLEEHLSSFLVLYFRSEYQKLADTDGEKLFDKLTDFWKLISKACFKLHHLFIKFERLYLSLKTKSSIRDLMGEKMCEIFDDYDQLKYNSIELLIIQINKLRKLKKPKQDPQFAETVEGIKNVCQFLKEARTFSRGNDFEPDFQVKSGGDVSFVNEYIKDSKKYFKQALDRSNPSQLEPYSIFLKEMFTMEEFLAVKLLDENLLLPVKMQMREILIKDQLPKILGKELEKVLEQKKKEIFDFYLKMIIDSGCLSAFVEFLAFFTTKKIEEIFKDENQERVIPRLHSLYSDLSELAAQQPADSSEKIRSVIVRKFEKETEKHENNLAEYFSNCVHSKLCKSNLGQKRDDEILKELEQVFEIFRFIQSKDILKGFYNKR